MRNAYKILVEKPERKIKIQRPYLKERGFESVEWINLAQDKFQR
jgi:hypothetical protein